MNQFEHIAYLLEQGKKPKDIVELGFSKRVVTRVFRKLKEEKRAARQESERAASPSNEIPPLDATTNPSELVSLKEQMKRLESRMEALEVLGMEMKKLAGELEDLGADLEKKNDQLTNIRNGVIIGPAVIILKPNLICDCGESGRIAVHLKCLKCGKDHWWYWNPEEQSPISCNV